MRLRIDLAYDGTAFHGWAVQPSLRTVQGVLESALAQVLRLESASVTCAGRTDTGVHARGQVVHLDLDAAVLDALVARGTSSGPESLLRRLNGVLSSDVRVRAVSIVPAAFDARFSALWRRYAYRVADGPELVDPLVRTAVLDWPRRLDLDAMNTAAGLLTGEHDFASFCKKREGATTIRTLLELTWSRDPSGLAVATVRADAFCHNMVRALMGCLVAVGEHRRTPSWAADVLVAGNRDPAVRVMPARGLTLEAVAYPPDERLADQATTTRAVRTLG